MYKIIIVDDEPLMLEGFSKVINWNEHGYQLIGAFRNPLEILDFVKQTARILFCWISICRIWTVFLF